MSPEGLTGSRIRERRIIRGMRQADLARDVGISASYLNLIEHNRRRIGGKILLDIAAALDVEAQSLTHGAEAALVASLREAGEAEGLPIAEAERAEELAGRFPGWADVMARMFRRLSTLERTVEKLSDRLAHDPQLAATLYELLSTAASIRSTAAILAETEDIDAGLMSRFHANMNQDSQRLSDSSKLLVRFLDAEPEETSASPLEELEAFLETRDFSFPELESGQTDVETLVESADADMSAGAKRMARHTLGIIEQDARRISGDAMAKAYAEMGLDPVALAAYFEVSLPVVFRRLAVLPDLDLGLIVCDRTGSFLFRKPKEGFSIPRFGAACTLWPLYEALSVPGQILHRMVIQQGRSEARFECFAIAEAVGSTGYNTHPLLQSTMLIANAGETDDAEADASLPEAEVGVTCRICPRQGCAGRRETSILSQGF